MRVSSCRSGRLGLGTVDLWGWIILWDEAALVCPLMSGSIPGLYLLVVTSIAPVVTPGQRHPGKQNRRWPRTLDVGCGILCRELGDCLAL